MLRETHPYREFRSAARCPEQDSNLHVVKHSHLKRARLPFRHLGSGISLPKSERKTRLELATPTLVLYQLSYFRVSLPSQVILPCLEGLAVALSLKRSAKVRLFSELTNFLPVFFTFRGEKSGFAPIQRLKARKEAFFARNLRQLPASALCPHPANEDAPPHNRGCSSGRIAPNRIA